MSDFKEKAGNVFGSIFGIVYFIASLLLSVFPIAMLGLPFWADFLIIVGVNIFGAFLFGLPELALWIVALVVTINGKQDGWAIAYYVAFGLVVLKILIRNITALLRN